MTEGFEALRSAVDNLSDFQWRKGPKCPHCGADLNVHDHELWELYAEGGHAIECPRCDAEFIVNTHCQYSFSTDEQEAMDD